MKKLLLFFFLLYSTPIWATQPALVAANHVEGFWDGLTAKTTYALTLPISTTLHNYIVVHYRNCSVFNDCVTSGVGAYFDAATDDQANTYYDCNNNLGRPVGGPFIEHWGTLIARVTTAGSTTVTIHSHIATNIYNGQVTIYEVDLGVSDANPCDATTPNYDYKSGTSSVSISTASTLTASNEWLDCWYGGDGPQTSFNSPFSQIQTETGGLKYVAIAGGVASSNGTQTCTINFSGTLNSELSISALKAAAAPITNSNTSLLLMKVGGR